MGMIENTIEFVLKRMSKEEKRELIGKLAAKFLVELSADDKKQMICELAPQMMKGIRAADVIPQLMMELAPKLLEMTIAAISVEKRGEFARALLTTLVEHGSSGMPEKEALEWAGMVGAAIKSPRSYGEA